MLPLDQEAKLAYSSMKQRTRTTEEPNQAVVGRLVAEMKPEACSYLPPKDTLKRTLRVQSEGLQELYTFDPDINLEVRMIPALAMVPQDDVEQVFTELVSSLHTELLPVVDYFEDVVIRRPTARGRRDAQFPVKLWNHHDSVLQGDSKTTNSGEAWHRVFLVLQREDSLELHRLGKLEMRQRFSQASKYAKAAERLKTLAREYGRRDSRRFLSGVARNVPF
ncbi:hypothetical protein HPB47_017651 [Ixodes persulcatus]|uniref:Uncharacterized protein n=1 Tax=Ixodes persulcatus TaxID=34615 RepID=A0AC60QQ36_IXOPE|nr:hypothetical protein HPB47_017651 [Ixodes persulcatus]